MTIFNIYAWGLLNKLIEGEKKFMRGVKFWSLLDSLLILITSKRRIGGGKSKMQRKFLPD